MDGHVPLPNIRVIVQQHNMSYTGSVLNTPCRQTIVAQDWWSPVLTSGSRPVSVSVCNKSIFDDPTGNTVSYFTVSSSPASAAASTDTHRLCASLGGTSEVASSNMAYARDRVSGVDKTDSVAINVIILRTVLQDNYMVGQESCDS